MNASPSHLDLLEAESIHIFREAAAQFRKPVLMYSIGKDSTVLLHLARKAFWPQKPPFPLLHIDTTWKFKEMIAFRDKTVNRSCAVNPHGRSQDARLEAGPRQAWL
jgi:sulfate adenylyltransferase subunit 2